MEALLTLVVLATCAFVVWQSRKLANDRAADQKELVSLLYEIRNEAVGGASASKSARDILRADREVWEERHGAVISRLDEQRLLPVAKVRNPETGKLQSVAANFQIDPETGVVDRSKR